MIKRIDHIDIAVKDVEKAIEAFQKIGFELLNRTSHRGDSAELKLPGDNQPIIELNPPVSFHRKGECGLIHIAFLVDNAQETYDEFKAKGITFADGWEGPRSVKYTGRKLIDLPEVEDWGSIFLQFVEEGRKPPLIR